MTNENWIIMELLHWLVSALALMLTAYLVRGFRIKSFWSALAAALVIGFVNLLIRPFLLFLTLPLNILTLGLFTFVVNGAVLKISAAVLPGFEIKTWGAAVLGAFVLALVGTGLHFFLI